MLVEEEGREEGWVFQETQGKRNMVKYLDQIFNRDPRKTQERREMDISEGIEIEEYTSMIGSLRRVPTT